MYSLEALISLKKSHLEMLESCDRALMHSLFLSPRTVPSEAFYFETAAIPLRFHLVSRRFMYLWSILQKPSSELTRKIFDCQVLMPSKDTWVFHVLSELSDYDIQLTFDQISEMTRATFKQVVMHKVRMKAYSYLSQIQATHSKTKNLTFGRKPQLYLNCSELTLEEKRLLFLLRCESNFCKNNYRMKYQNDMSCFFCQDTNSLDSVPHYIRCNVLNSKPGLQDRLSFLQPSDIYDTLEKQVNFVKVWTKIEKLKRQDQPS